jgi:hypothetical protein
MEKRGSRSATARASASAIAEVSIPAIPKLPLKRKSQVPEPQSSHPPQNLDVAPPSRPRRRSPNPPLSIGDDVKEISTAEATLPAELPNRSREMAPSASLDKKLINSLKNQGAAVENHGTRKEPYYTIEMKLHDQAHNLFVAHCIPDGQENPDAKDDHVVQLVLPNPGVGVVPRMAQQAFILAEAGSIVTAYQNLLAAAFAPVAPVPALGPAIVLPPRGLPYHHATIAAHKFVERISNPGPACPNIDQQPAGTILCTVLYLYAMVAINVPRN